MARNGEQPSADAGPASVAADFTERYRLGLAEFEKVRDALAPAFALGLQQAMASPARWPELSQVFLAPAMPGREKRMGDNLLDLFFALPGLREAVSRQASAISGVAPGIVAEMMPRLAALGTEAMMRTTMANLLPRQAVGLPADEFARMTAEMMRRGANAVEALSTPSTSPRAKAAPMSPFFAFDAFAEAMRATMEGPVASNARSARDVDPPPPVAPLFEAFAKGMRSAAAITGTGEEAARGRADASERPDPDLVDAFVQSGRRLQDAHIREMTALFARFSDGKRGETS